MMNQSSTTLGLILEPLDTLFFRDGRPFEPAMRVQSGLPSPQTLSGALRTWLLRKAGCDFEKLGDAVRKGASFAEALQDAGHECGHIASMKCGGPWLAKSHAGSDPEPLLPMPSIVVETEKAGNGSSSLSRLAPLDGSVPLPGWKPLEEGMRPLWLRKSGKQRKLEQSFLDLAGLKELLKGGVPATQNVVTAQELYAFDRRTGIAVNPDTLSAETGMIYAADFLSLKREAVVLYAEITVPNAIAELIPEESETIPLGGEGRRVIVRRTNPVQWPSADPQNSKGRLLLLVTPGIFESSWCPGRLSGKLESASVPRYEAVSGWDLARQGPKMNRFAVKSGSVYFLKPNETHTGPLCNEEDDLMGWGKYLEGNWDHV